MTSVVWFRSDLRVADNTALHAACAGGGAVVGVYVVSPGEWRAHDVSGNQVDFRLRCARELSARLAKLNIALVVTRAETAGDVAKVLLRVAKAHGCEALHFNKEYEIDERRRDEAVTAAFEAAGVRVVAHTDQVLIEPGEVRTGEGKWYTVFTPFKRACVAWMKARGVPGVLPVPRKRAERVGEATAVPERVAGLEATIDPGLWAAGESAGRKMLEAFAKNRVEAYREARDFPAREGGTSRLSPYLAVGAVSIRQCLAAAIEANAGASSPLDSGNEGVTTWISELLWREFYVHVMVGFPRVCMHRPFQLATERVRWRDDPAGFEAWRAGRTGVPIVDAGMRELAATGWMHNRVRMITAMFLTKNLLIDWRLGERHFMRNLVDGFLASNNGGWQWSASTGTDAAPYFRVFNPVSQSTKFDPAGEYIRRWVPELRGVAGDAVHEPWTMAALARGRLEYPSPIVELGASRARAIEAFRGVR